MTPPRVIKAENYWRRRAASRENVALIIIFSSCFLSVGAICGPGIWWFQNGLFSALPFLGLSAVVFVAPVIADKLRTAGTMHTVTVRRVFNTTGEMRCVYMSLLLIGLHDATFDVVISLWSRFTFCSSLTLNIFILQSVFISVRAENVLLLTSDVVLCRLAQLVGTLVFGRRTDPVLRSVCSRRVTTMWVNRPLQVSQLGQLSLSPFRGR